ncbi:class I SAM-dependent methyltransferase [Pseudomonas sp. R3.Fl]|uniref:class I SAM-dependent methyltransferase n=1 Tax=Pseudomonas sp. R3.Fl TaxID=2928708 RepID=UPI00201D9797|nr:class I SAM-dependent methyltransferase [Pseudomonas sp. R3.Fl]
MRTQQEELSSLYRIRFPEKELQRKNEIWKVLTRDFLQRWVAPEDTVVDVACGYGEFINNIQARRRIGVDLNPDTRFKLERGIIFHQESATQLSNIGESSANVIFTSNFLEHLPDKKSLDIFLEQVLMTLRPGGRYLILGPNLRYLPGEYWDFYDHHLGLTHLSLAEALKLAGFQIEVNTPRFLPYTTQGKLPTHPLLVKLYLKCPWAWPVMGKQFFLVARKPGQ